MSGEDASEPLPAAEGLRLRSLPAAPFLCVARAGEFGGSGFRLTGEEATRAGCCLPKDRKDEMVVLRLAGRIGRRAGGGLGGEDREDFLGGKPEESILLELLDSAFDYSLIRSRHASDRGS